MFEKRTKVFIILLIFLLIGGIAWRYLAVFPLPADDVEHIVVDTWRNRLHFYTGAGEVLHFSVATGKKPEETPRGKFQIVRKSVLNPPETNPQLGVRWLGLDVPNEEGGSKYGIHGTDEPESIGQHASAGCIRMYNDDVIFLYEKVPKRTPVFVRDIPLPVKWFYQYYWGLPGDD